MLKTRAAVATPTMVEVEPYAFRAMGTEFEVHVGAGGKHGAGPSVQREIRRLEAIFSRFLPESELSHLNRTAGTWFETSPEMMAVLQRALKARRETSGLFEPAILPALLAAGYDRDIDVVRARNPRSVGAARLPNGITLDSEGGRVRLDPGVSIDLSGIAKGWAVERVFEMVGSNGLVNAGGDLRASGPSDEGYGWVVGVEDPRQPSREAFLFALDGEAAATSGIDRRRWGEGQHHLIDPRTGRPAATDLLTVTVIAEDCVTAEVIAKTTVILGRDEGARYLEDRGCAAIMIAADGKSLVTQSMKERVL